MSSVIDICNVALAHLGDTATVSSIDPPEGSAQAEHCARFYPVARDSLLEMHDWWFALRRTLLAEIVTDTWGWAFAYARPADSIRVLGVYPADAGSDDEPQPYTLETDSSGTPIILTNQEGAIARYVARVIDPTVFPPLFVDALSWLLASYLAGPIIKGEAGAAMGKECLKGFAYALANAKVSDANQRRTQPEHIPAWISGR